VLIAEPGVQHYCYDYNLSGCFFASFKTVCCEVGDGGHNSAATGSAHVLLESLQQQLRLLLSKYFLERLESCQLLCYYYHQR
jgi:hypothetical protein